MGNTKLLVGRSPGAQLPLYQLLRHINFVFTSLSRSLSLSLSHS